MIWKISVFKQNSNRIFRHFSIILRPVNFSDIIESVLYQFLSNLGFWFAKKNSNSPLSRLLKVARSQQRVKHAWVIVSKCVQQNVGCAEMRPLFWICFLGSLCKIVSRVLKIIVAPGCSQQSVMKWMKFVFIRCLDIVIQNCARVKDRAIETGL